MALTGLKYWLLWFAFFICLTFCKWNVAAVWRGKFVSYSPYDTRWNDFSESSTQKAVNPKSKFLERNRSLSLSNKWKWYFQVIIQFIVLVQSHQKRWWNLCLKMLIISASFCLIHTLPCFIVGRKGLNYMCQWFFLKSSKGGGD